MLTTHSVTTNFGGGKYKGGADKKFREQHAILKAANLGVPNSFGAFLEKRDTHMGHVNKAYNGLPYPLKQQYKTVDKWIEAGCPTE